MPLCVVMDIDVLIVINSRSQAGAGAIEALSMTSYLSPEA